MRVTENLKNINLWLRICKIVNHEVQITKTTCSPDKVPQLQGVDQQEYDTQEPRCGRGIGSEENKLGYCLICTFCQSKMKTTIWYRNWIWQFILIKYNSPFWLKHWQFLLILSKSKWWIKHFKIKIIHFAVSPNLLHKKYLTANIQCRISSIYFNEISLSCICPKVITLCVLEYETSASMYFNVLIVERWWRWLIMEIVYLKCRNAGTFSIHRLHRLVTHRLFQVALGQILQLL